MKFRSALLATALGLTFSLAQAGLACAQQHPLLDAVQRDDRPAVEALLGQKVDPNLRLNDGSTGLSWAVTHQNAEIVKLLLAAGGDPNARDIDGMTPLLYACQYSNADIVSMLLDAKGDSHAARPDGISALSMCARNSSAAVVQRMITAGAAADVADINGQTPLMWAAAGGNTDTIQSLLKQGARVNAVTLKGFTPLFFAVKSDNPKAPEVLLDAGANINHVATDGTTAIMLATYKKDEKVAILLAQRGAELNHWDENGNQPLHVAAIQGQVELAKVLIAKGADVDARSMPPRVNWQTEPNAGRNPQPKVIGMTPLLTAANWGKTDVMKVLVAAGAKKDFKGDDGTNIVLSASMGGSTAALAYAIELQPDLNVANEYGQTPLHIVVQNRRIQVTGHISPETADMVRLLAAKGAPLLAKNARGQTPADSVRRATPDIQMAFEQAVLSTGAKMPEPRARNRTAEAEPAAKPPGKSKAGVQLAKKAAETQPGAVAP